MIKQYIKAKQYKKIMSLLMSLLSFLFTTTFGFLILVAVTITFIVVGVSGNTTTSDNSNLNGVPSEYIEYFNEASEKFKIPNWCLAAVAKQESNFNPSASYNGAYGMMQIQRIDASGIDLWANHINGGLGEEYKKLGYEFSSPEEMWNIYLKEPKAQIIAGGYIIRYYSNYVLFKNGYVEKLEYNNNENMQLINWNANENDKEFRDTLRRIFACYNGGPGYGMGVDLDTAQHDYPNKVFKYAITFRDSGLNGSGTPVDNETIEKAIQAGMNWVGKSPYVWGGGRTQADVDAGRFDCSSFVHYMYASAGIQLGDRGSVVTFTLVNMGEKINSSDMQRGDIIFFDTYTIDGHVGVYLGDNKFLHDGPTNGVEVSDMTTTYWQQTFNGKVRRVIK